MPPDSGGNLFTEVNAVNLGKVTKIKFQTGRRIRDTVTDTELLAKMLPALIWIVAGLIPQGLMLLAGKVKIGKSLLALGIASAVARGAKVFDTIQVQQLEVLYFALEDTDRRLQSHISKIQGNIGTGRLYFSMSGPKEGESITSFLEGHIADHPGVKLIVIDTLGKFCGCQGISSYKESYSRLGELKAVADKYHLAILIVHHTTKAKAKDAFDAIMGSTGITGSADTIAVLTRERGQNEGALTITGREVEDNVFAMRFEPETLSWELVGEAEVPMSDERREVLDLLREEDKEMKLKDIAAALGKKGPVLSKLLNGLKECGLVEQQRHGFYKAVPVDSGENANDGERGENGENGENAVGGENECGGEDSDLGESADSGNFIEAGVLGNLQRERSEIDTHASLPREASDPHLISGSVNMISLECAEGFFEFIN